MKWYNHLYVGENAKKRKHKIIMRAIRHKPQVGVYMITLPMNENDALDIFLPTYCCKSITKEKCICGRNWRRQRGNASAHAGDYSGLLS